MSCWADVDSWLRQHLSGTTRRTAEDVCELNILQIPKKTLTIEKLRAYLLLTKNFYIKINKIESVLIYRLLVFYQGYLAELTVG